MNHTPSRRAAAAVTSALALSACASLTSGDDFLDQSPRSMAKAAFADMRQVTSVRILGSQEGDAGFARVDIRLDDTNCTGRIRTDDGDLRFIKNSEGSWLQADKEYWRSQASSPREAERVSAAYGGSWVAVPGRSGFLKMCDLDEFLDNFKLDKNDTEDTLDAGEVEKVGDVKAVAIHGRDGKKRVTAWVAVESPHRVLKMAPTDDTGMPDALFFGAFDANVKAETPPQKDIVTIPGG